MKKTSREKRRLLYPSLLGTIITASLLLLPAPLSASEDLGISCNAQYADTQITAEIQAQKIPSERLREALTAGHAAEIRFDMRLFHKRRGISSILGDSLIRERTETYRGMWNPVIRGYSLALEEDKIFFEEFSAFLRSFSASTLSLPLLQEEIRDSEDAYILVRVTVIPRVPEPPFTLLAPFLPGLSLSSPWKEVPFEHIKAWREE
ncbi:MAG: hypothetical protein ACLFSA_02340 [Spirochaetaceae bacterium]